VIGPRDLQQNPQVLPRHRTHDLEAIESRLQRIETVLEDLKSAVTKLSGAVSAGTPPALSSRTAHSPDTSLRSQVSTSQSNLLASLAQASEDLEMMRGQVGSRSEHQNASAGLRNLSDAFSTMKFSGPTTSKKESGNFFVPDRQTGYALMSSSYPCLLLRQSHRPPRNMSSSS